MITTKFNAMLASVSSLQSGKVADDLIAAVKRSIGPHDMLSLASYHEADTDDALVSLAKSDNEAERERLIRRINVNRSLCILWQTIANMNGVSPVTRPADVSASDRGAALRELAENEVSLSSYTDAPEPPAAQPPTFDMGDETKKENTESGE